MVNNPNVGLLHLPTEEGGISPMPIDATVLSEELQSQRRKVDFDTFDVLLQQLLVMIAEDQIKVAPGYQRQFRWDEIRSSQLVESIFLGIPVPNVYMATNADSTWELVDGVQRLSSVVRFCGSKELREGMLGAERASPLVLKGLEKLVHFNGLSYADLPQSMQLQFRTRSLKVITLSDKSDEIVRFDLFERLNRGGVSLSDQEIRDCVFRGPFADFLAKLSGDAHFGKFLKLTTRQNEDGTKEECVLRFFAFMNEYEEFVHSVVGFLNGYMKSATRSFDYVEGERQFRNTFKHLVAAMPNGLTRLGKKTKGTTPLNLFEGVAVGAALALKMKSKLNVTGIDKWLGSDDLKKFTTGATNNLSAVKGRIEYCRDRFLGK